MPAPKKVYQLKVTLAHSKPPIWRRIIVPEDVALSTLHEIIQRVMGWHNYHLHMFTINGQIYGDPEDDEYGEMGTKNETRYRINRFGLREKSKFAYEYDFGDSWEHTILVEKISFADPSVHFPVCVTGKRACPPEDVGGIWGYANFLEVIADSNHAEHDETLDWIGGDFDPEEFDLDDVNTSLQFIKPARGRRKNQKEEGPEDDDEVIAPDPREKKAMAAALYTWAQNLSGEQSEKLYTLPLRRDMLTFLDYLTQNRTIGTQSTGNLPLKAVREISQKFVGPLVLDQTINGHSLKLHSEDEVFPLQFLHLLAFQSDLVTGGNAKLWQVTSEGQLFPQLPPPLQVYFLVANWWAQADWTTLFLFQVWQMGFPHVSSYPHCPACVNCRLVNLHHLNRLPTA